MTMLERIKQTEAKADQIRNDAKQEVIKMLSDAKKSNDDFRKTSYENTLLEVKAEYDQTEILLSNLLHESNLKLKDAKEKDLLKYDSHLESALTFIKKAVIDS